jgi:hypothetical protein
MKYTWIKLISYESQHAEQQVLRRKYWLQQAVINNCGRDD